jgi:hypothetical protein
MDDERFERMLRLMAKQLVELNSGLLELTASVTALKVAVARLAGDDPEAALAHFRDVEKKALESLPASQKLQEARDLIAVFEKPGKTLGKNKA